MGKLLAVDIGGTYIKYALGDEKYTLLTDTVSQAPSCAEESMPQFLENLRSIIREMKQKSDLNRACVCIGGPFDFDNGISLMKHKFEALYGQSMKEPFEDEHVPVTFMHDSTAFMLGEFHDGVLSGTKNACCVMLGTGLGFAWVKDGRVCLDASQTPSVKLWSTPYMGGIAEDWVSTRAIQRYYGQELPVKAIADLARSGDERAVSALRTAGEHLSCMMEQVIKRLGCERMALGGQIAKSADLLHLSVPVPWMCTVRPEEASLRGMCCYAAMGRDACTQTLTMQFEPLEGSRIA